MSPLPSDDASSGHLPPPGAGRFDPSDRSSLPIAEIRRGRVSPRDVVGLPAMSARLVMPSGRRRLGWIQISVIVLAVLWPGPPAASVPEARAQDQSTASVALPQQPAPAPAGAQRLAPPVDAAVWAQIATNGHTIFLVRSEAGPPVSDDASSAPTSSAGVATSPTSSAGVATSPTSSAPALSFPTSAARAADSPDLADPRQASPERGRVARTSFRAARLASLVADGTSRLAPLDARVADLVRAGHVTWSQAFPLAGVLAVDGDATALNALAGWTSTAEVRANRVHRLVPLPPEPLRPLDSPLSRDSLPTTDSGLPPAPTSAPLSPLTLPWAHLLHTPFPHTSTAAGQPAALPTDTQWNLLAVRAPAAWQAYGATGEGVTVATIDSGVDFRHPALWPRYRGRDRGHDFNWMDFADSGAVKEPVDPVGHGTHVTGLMVGRMGSSAMGVAIGAEWIAVRAFNADGEATDVGLLRSAEWVAGPTDLSGQVRRFDLAPDIVNCSWVLENGADPLYAPVIAAWRAAGILPVFAAGNDEQGLGTYGGVLTPAAEPGALAVGAISSDGRPWALSMRGPSFLGLLKPQLMAPGVNIFSTFPDASYGYQSGTSMAAPHVSGAAALVWSANPELTVDDVERFLTHTASRAASAQPDLDHGWGTVDASAAVLAAQRAGWVAGQVGRPAGVEDAGVRVRIRARPDDAPGASGPAWEVWADSAGSYRLALPSGRWAIEASAFGAGDVTRMVGVSAHQVTRLDLPLAGIQVANLTGRVLTAAGLPLPAARIAVLPAPTAWTVAPADPMALPQAGTDGEGRFRLSLPAGTHALRVGAEGYQAISFTLTVGAGESLSREVILPPSPSILLVDADAWAGPEWPAARIAPYLRRALEDAGFEPGVLTIDRLSAVPDLSTLLRYDVVVWAHQTNGSPGFLDAQRHDRRATDTLTRFVHAGGRLLVTGQNLAWRDAGEGPAVMRLAPEFFRQVLGARFVSDLGIGLEAHGVGPFDGLALNLKWPLGEVKLRGPSPDVIAPAWGSGAKPSEAGAGTGLNEPILTFGDGQALGLATSDLDGRRMFWSFAPESAGDRGALANAFDAAVGWLAAPALALSAERDTLPPVGTDSPGVLLTVTLRAGRPGAPVSVTLAAAAGLRLEAAGAAWARVGDRLVWNGIVAPAERLDLHATLRLERPMPGGAALPVTATVESAAKSLSESLRFWPLYPDLSASTATVSASRLAAGGVVTYALAIENRGRADATAATATVVFPPTFEPMTGTLTSSDGHADWVFDGTGWTLRWRGELQAGRAAVQLRVAGRLPEGLGAVHSITATIEAGPGLVVVRDVAVLVGGPDLAGSRWLRVPATVVAGEAFTVSLELVNSGRLPALVDLAPQLPPGILPALAGALGSAMSAAETESEVADGLASTASPSAAYPVPPGGRLTVVLPLLAAPDAPSGPRRIGVVLDDGLRPPAPVTLVADLQLRRSDLSAARAVLFPEAPRSGDWVTATVLVANFGDVAAPVEVVDSLPPALALDPGSVRVTSGQTSTAPATVRWQTNVAPAAEDYVWHADGRGAPWPDDARGEPLPPGDPNGLIGPISLGLPFPFYTEVVTRAWVARTGLVIFAPEAIPATPSFGPAGLRGPAIAPLWRSGADPRAARQPRVIREADRVTLFWPAHAGGDGWAVELEPTGGIRFRYGPAIGATDGVVGIQSTDGRRLDLGGGFAGLAESLRFDPPAAWEWITFRARVGAALGPNSSVAHSARLRGPGVDRTLTAAVPVNAVSLEESRLTASTQSPTAGSWVTFTLRVRASGAMDARGLVAQVTLPEVALLVPESLTGGLRWDDRLAQLVWEGRLAPGTEQPLAWSVRVRADVQPGARLLTTARLRAQGVAPAEVNQTLVVRSSDFSGSRKAVSRLMALPGEAVEYTLRAVNSGTTRSQVEVTDALPAGLAMVAGSASSSTGMAPDWDELSRSLRWLGELGPAEAVELRFAARLVGAGRVTNAMRVSDGAGTDFAAWADLLPARSRIVFPYVTTDRR